MAIENPAPDAATEKFVTLLRRHRIANGLTQAALAKKLKVVPSTVCGWESGESFPTPKLVPDLARILGVDAMTLTKMIEPEMPNPGASAR